MNFLEFIQIVKDENACYDLYEQWKWGDKVVSPFDPTSKVYKCKNHKYKCKNTNRYFTVKTVRFLLLNGSMLCGYLLKGKEAYLPIRYLEILMFLKRPHGVCYIKTSEIKMQTITLR